MTRKFAYFAYSTLGKGHHAVFPVYEQDGKHIEDLKDIRSTWPSLQQALEETGRLNS